MRSSEDQTVVFSGPHTVRTVSAAHSRLCTAFAASPAVSLDLGDVTEADLSFVQLIEAARISAGLAGGRLVLSAPAAGSLHDVLTRGGFLDAEDHGRREFWLHAGADQ